MSLVERDRTVLWHPYAPVDPELPLWEVEAAAGVRLQLRDEAGLTHEVVDAMSSWWCMIHGYRNPVLDAAVASQLASFSHVMFGGLTHAPAVNLAERLVELTPAGLDRVFRGGYHGDTFAAMSVCDPVDGMHSAFSGLLASNVFAPRPPAASSATPDDVVRWAAQVAALAAARSDELAAIIVEPVLQGAGGVFA